MAQGAVSTGAIAARGAATSVTRGVPTAARIANGATVEREVAYRIDRTNAVRLGLRNPDLTTARRIATAINQVLGPVAKATDPRTVALDLANRDPIEALATMENLRVEPDNRATVFTTFRTQIDDPIGALNHLEIVFNYHDRVARITELH